MGKNVWLLFLLLTGVSLFGDELPDQEEAEVTHSCSLSVALAALPDETVRASGRARFSAFLCNRHGEPSAGETLQITATHGTLLCTLPGDSSVVDGTAATSCFTTGKNGRLVVYLINIPLNQVVQVKAHYDCGEYLVSGTGNLVISRSRTNVRQ